MIQANILINQNHRACLADFGLSTIVSGQRPAGQDAPLISLVSRVSLMSFTTGGTLRWVSPELLDPERFGVSDGRPTKQSDCYAFGMVVYEVRPQAVNIDLRGIIYGSLGTFRETTLLGRRERRGSDERHHRGSPTEETGRGGGSWVH
jgi:serine/threonine protein kinase